MNTRSYLLGSVVGLMLLVPSVSFAQSETTQTNFGLQLLHPASWNAEEFEADSVNLVSSDGWRIEIRVGEAASAIMAEPYAYANAVDVSEEIFNTMFVLGSLNFDTLSPLYLDSGDGVVASGHYFVDTDTIPAHILLLNLSDGQLLVSTLFNGETQEEMNPEILNVFYDILGSVVLVMDETPSGAVRFDELPPQFVQFANGVEFHYPEGWQFYDSDSPYFYNTVSVYYGASIYVPEAIAVVTIYEESDLEYQHYRETVFSLTGMINTGLEDFVPERDIITETLDNGLVMESIRLGEEALLGNTYNILLTEDYWVNIMVMSFIPLEELEADISSIVNSFDFVEPEVETTMFEDPMTMFLRPEDYRVADCFTQARENDSTPIAGFICPANCASSGATVWGTNIYTHDSSICVSAVHAGVIQNETGGAVVASWLGEQDSYLGSTQNGITTSEYGQWYSSYSVAASEDN